LFPKGPPLNILWGFSMNRTTAPIPFAGSELDATRDVCAFFNSDAEQHRVLLPFTKDGFQCSHKAIHVVNPDQRQSHLRRLDQAGIDPTIALQSGQLELRSNVETYLPDGRFDPDRMIAAFEQLASNNAKAAFPLSRICCRMDWAVEDRSHVDNVIEFESRVNEVRRRHDDTVICTYHFDKFGVTP
jgi:MEDS: MEthanogen/methylotroph, DcmR Sensory domain